MNAQIKALKTRHGLLRAVLDVAKTEPGPEADTAVRYWTAQVIVGLENEASEPEMVSRLRGRALLQAAEVVAAQAANKITVLQFRADPEALEGFGAKAYLRAKSRD